MAENLIVNGVTYNGVDSIAMKNENGETVHYYVNKEELLPAVDILNYIKTEANEVAQKVRNVLTDDSIVFLAMSDSHHCGEQSDTGWQTNTNIGNLHAGMAAKALAYALDMDFVCHLGDITFGHGTTTSKLLHQQISEMNGWLDEAFRGIPQFRTVGNHDTGIYAYASGTETTLETADYLFSAFGAYCDGAVYGSRTHGYCYRDFNDKKLRVICLNTSEGLTNAGYNAGYVCSPAQLLWFAQTLYSVGSKSDGAEWSIIVLGHYPLDYLDTHPASAVVKAYVEGGSTTQNGTTVNFSGHNYAKFVAQFHGHTHCFKYAKLNTINTSTNKATEYDAWRIAVPNSGFYRNNHQNEDGNPDKYGLFFRDDVTYDKTIGGANDTAFVVNVVNPSQQMIHSFCYGAGYDRTIGYAAIVYYSVTKTVTNATISNSATSVEKGTAYTATITANSGYTLEAVKVTMGGTDVTASVYSNGVINIPQVTGNVVITASAAKLVTYKNLVRSSIDSGGAVYNSGKGYKDNLRIGSGGGESSYSGFAATGFIKLPADGNSYTLRVGGEGIEWGVYGCQVCVYDASFAVSSVSMNYAQIGNTGYGTWDTTEDTAFTLTVQKSHAFTTAAYMRISAKGSGSNMVVTINEKIE